MTGLSITPQTIFYGVEDWCLKDKKMNIKEYLYYTFKKICSLF